MTGNGAIKLVLYNDNPNGLTDDEVCGEVGDTLAFARYDDSENGLLGKTQFASNNERNGYIGYMYGTPGSSSYDNEHANLNDSVILSNLKKWYDANFNSSNGINLIEDVIWCNDKSIYNGTGISRDVSYYSSGGRYNSKKPSLICPTAGADGKLSKFTALDSTYGNAMLKTEILDTNPVSYKYYKIGLITLDEYIYSSSEKSFFLENSMDKWWTITPESFVTPNGSGSYVFAIKSDGNINWYNTLTIIGLRPSIALIPTVQATYNTAEGADAPGTVNNPYIVNIS